MLKEIPESLLDEAVREIKENDYTIFLYGGGNLGKFVCSYLKENGVKVGGFLIDKTYMKKDVETIQGLPVYAFEDYINNNKDIVVFVSFFPEDKNLTKNFNNLSDNIKRIYDIGILQIGALSIHGMSYVTKDFYIKNYNRIQEFEDMLCDEKSLHHLEAWLYQSLRFEKYKVQWKGNQYFPGDIIKFEKDEVFVDCGTFDGVTSLKLMKNLHKAGINSFEKIYCFEPDSENRLKAENNLKYNDRELIVEKIYNDDIDIETLLNIKPYFKDFTDRITIIPKGVWSRKTEIKFSLGRSFGSRFDENSAISIPVDSIDNVLEGVKATFIKMDIEGSELEALKGAEQTIKKYKPKLAVCIYHKASDVIEIPEYIHSLNPDYKFYLRNHSPIPWDTVLYAI